MQVLAAVGVIIKEYGDIKLTKNIFANSIKGNYGIGPFNI